MLISKVLCAVLFSASWTAFAQPDDSEPQAKPEPTVTFNPADMQDKTDWKRRDFDVVVVVNKAVNAETIEVYVQGELKKQRRVSSGRETVSHADPSNPEAPAHTYFTQTPTGYFTPYQLDIDHHSNEWAEKGPDGEASGAFMPWAVFFNSGIATHRSPYEDLVRTRGLWREQWRAQGITMSNEVLDPDARDVVDHRIGTRASGGCVRLHEGDAKDIFWWVRETGGPWDKSPEKTRKHAAGEPDFSEESAVEEANGNEPYAVWPQVADIDETTGAYIDAQTGAKIPNHDRPAKTHKGWRTLYIVMNNPLPKGALIPDRLIVGKMIPAGSPIAAQTSPDVSAPVVPQPAAPRPAPAAPHRQAPAEPQDPVGQFFQNLFQMH